MKRPEGFDRPAPAVASTRKPRRARPREAAGERAGSSPARPAEPAPVEAPARRAVSPEKLAAAELKRAARDRRRAERLEMRRFTRRTRRRRVAWITAAGVVLAMVALLLVAVYSPLLALRTITIDGTSRLDAATLHDAVDDQLGTPLALVDEDRITKDLSKFSLIRSYATELVPPSTLLIHIVERVPVASIERGDGFDLVDPAGVVVDSTTERPAGVPLLQLAASDDTSSPAFASMTEVLLALPPATVAQVDTVSARTRDDVTLTLIGGAQTVIWGSAKDSVRKGEALSSLLAVNDSRAGTYDVSAPSSVVFRAR